MRLVFVIIALLAVCMPAVAVDLLPDDAALSKAVTLDFKGEALSDVVKVLAKTADVRIRTSEDVADQKVTILVDKMPIRDVLNRLATLFGWNWTVKKDDEDRDTYVIYGPLKKKRDADRQAALDKAWKALGAKLDSMSVSADGKVASFYKKLALLQYKSLSPDLRKAYLSGMHICYNTKSSITSWQPSQIAMNEFASAGNQTEKPVYKEREGWAAWKPDPTKPSEVTIELYSAVDANLVVARCKVTVNYLHPDSGKGMGYFGIGTSIWADSKSAGTPASEGGLDLCVQEIDHPSETLENKLPDKPADELLSKKVSISAADLVDEGAVVVEWAGGCSATRTDLLAALHKKLGVQVISDYYSRWGLFTDVQDVTIKQLIEEKLPGSPSNWGWDGSVLYTRVKDIRTADSREIPNRYLRPWQAVVKKKGYRGLEELAQAAAYMSGEQKQAISEDCRYLKLGECKEIRDLAGWESTLLRFYGLLTLKQKKDIFDTSVGVMELTQEQKNALAALLYSYNFNRAGVYNNYGLDTNDPQHIRGSAGAPAARVQMDCSGSFIYLMPGDDDDSRFLRTMVATTPEEALTKAQNQLGKALDPQNVVAQDDIIYTLTVSYNGGPANTIHRVTIKVPKEKSAPRVGKR